MIAGACGLHLNIVGIEQNDRHHDDVIKWKHFPGYWPFVRGIHRSRWIPHRKSQWRRALMFPLICAWINGWVNIREVGDLRRAHYDVNVMRYKRRIQRRLLDGQDLVFNFSPQFHNFTQKPIYGIKLKTELLSTNNAKSWVKKFCQWQWRVIYFTNSIFSS